ncbi:MAG: enoyl-CoA hydratase [Nitrospinota bacterium]|nr:MAG: enoyl-CoA hydratase [Nitrospinota bacterium]
MEKEKAMERKFGANVHLTIKGPIAWVVIDRPPLNLLTAPLVQDFRAALTIVSQQKTLRVLVVTGGGEKAFIAGVDVKEMVDLTPPRARRFISLLHAAMHDLRRLPLPVIARVNGYALGGGCEMAMACDLRIASTQARFGMPEVRLGIPSVIEAALMPALIGGTRAMDLLLTGRMIDAQTALDWGLVNRMVETEALDAAVEEMIRHLLQCAPEALAAQKRLIYQWMDSSMSQAFRLGIDAFARAYRTTEPHEGMRAFQEKRSPRWGQA